MDVGVFRRELARRGLGVSGVGRHRMRPEVLVVFLAGPVKRWHEHSAVGAITDIPGVLAATESVRSPAVVLVRIDPDHPDKGTPASGTPRQPGASTGADLPGASQMGADWSDLT